MQAPWLTFANAQWLILCADAFLVRHATLIVGAIALTIAFQQIKISRGQSRISQRQLEMTQQQRKIEAAVARIAIDPFIDKTLGALSQGVSYVFHTDSGERDGNWTLWFWEPRALAPYDEVEVPSDIEAKAAVAHPDGAAKIVALAKAVSEAQALSKEFAETPWQVAEGAAAIHDPSQRDQEMSRKTNTVLNRVFRLANECSPYPGAPA